MGQKISKDELVYQQVIEGNIDTIKALCTEGARLEWIDKEGKTPLIVACMDPRLYIVAKTLIELGANVNAYRPGVHAGTPLHHAAKRGLDHTVKLLLLHGANPFARNDDCQTPLDVARTKGYCNVVRAIEAHICYFSGDMREILVVPGILGSLVPHRLARKSSKKSWVVVVPCSLPNTRGPLKLEFAVYSSAQDPQPRTVIPLWKSNIVEPKFHESDPSLTIVNESTGSLYKFLSAIEGDKQQLGQLHSACKGLLKVMPSPQLFSAGNSAQPEVNTRNQPELSAGSNSQSSSATNGWSDLDSNVTHSECGQSSVPPPTKASCNGWANEPAAQELNGWADEPTAQELNGWADANSGPSMPPVNPTTVASAPIPSTPSAPPLPMDGGVNVDGPIHYPAIDMDPVDLSATSSEANGKTEEPCCVICWEAPVEGACIPCGHMAGCMSCLSEIKSKKGLCPVCRTKIDQVIRLYAV
ncbi:putative E3 ubiquitin-protein ligase XBAT35 [Chenopodium quinoa]|uniref:putative E3 ubiquitin-protein ligase XBAT35 n=1 Tax=Chenopodium quinoa TaxID=63459 RepID=UPI000B77E5F2|nr:putative E3 ubiquitin-protein ligase XBAT35 [Chenopodium quinoa]